MLIKQSRKQTLHRPFLIRGPKLEKLKDFRNKITVCTSLDHHHHLDRHTTVVRRSLTQSRSITDRTYYTYRALRRLTRSFTFARHDPRPSRDLRPLPKAPLPYTPPHRHRWRRSLRLHFRPLSHLLLHRSLFLHHTPRSSSLSIISHLHPQLSLQ